MNPAGTDRRPDVDESVQAWLRRPHGLQIAGGRCEPAKGGAFEVEDPSIGEPIARVAEGTAVDVDRAVAAARRAFEDPAWSEMTPRDRSMLLWRIGDAIDEHGDELAELEALDNGKSKAVARAVDVTLSADWFRYMAGLASRLEGATIPVSMPFAPGSKWHVYTRREPIGVVGQIIPWNFPLLMAAWKLAPALAAGCTVVLKPAEQTPLSALRLGELIGEIELPPGVLNVVTGFGETAGAALAAHPDVDKVAFTGSTEVGKLIVDAAKGNLKKVTLELGGKSPNVIFPDADLDLAIPGAANGIFFNHGQCCTAGSRLYVHEDVFDEVVSGVADAARQIKLGPGLDDATEMGPLVSGEQLERVVGYLSSAADEGATAVAGGSRHGERGYFVEPTILVDTTPDMKVVAEEIFGPVVAAMPFADPDEVPAAANQTIYGLAAGIWTRDLSTAHRMAERLKAGTVWINSYNASDPAMPFGGYKQSGWGREHGSDALHEYTETKTVCISI